MCSDADSTPPVSTPPLYTVTADHRTLTAADGAQFRSFLARPNGASGPGIVVLPDNRGLSAFYERVAVHLAEQGYPSIAIDYFGRTAGTGPRDSNFSFMKHIVQVKRETIDADIAVAAAYLHHQVNCRSILALGFCLGGRQAFFASAPRFGFAGVLGFYGAPGVYPNGAAGPTQRASELGAPILGIFGGADHGIPPQDVKAFDDALHAAKVEHEFVTYPNAPHSFFDIHYEDHAAACADAWRRVLAFIRKSGGDQVVSTGG